MSADGNFVIIRKCVGIEEFNACIALQKEVWGFEDLDVVPLRLFVVADKIGGQIIGAFDGPTLVGFALSIPGSRNGHLYLHSHMLAVCESYRNQGLGRRLKLAQREEALERGFELMEWTFDPLEFKNAYLNMEKLGAIARRYTINQYGMSSSHLQGGLPTDRLVAEWWLNSDRVQAVLAGAPRRSFNAAVKIMVPSEISQWKASEAYRARAKELQASNREVFLHAFAEGYAVLACQRDTQGNGTFVLGVWDEGWSYAS